MATTARVPKPSFFVFCINSEMPVQLLELLLAKVKTPVLQLPAVQYYSKYKVFQNV
jgi:hypothetical protein